MSPGTDTPSKRSSDLKLGIEAGQCTEAWVWQVTHMPPELLCEGRLSKAADVYAFGVLMWELVTGLSYLTRQNSHRVILYKKAKWSKLRPCLPRKQRAMRSQVGPLLLTDEKVQLVGQSASWAWCGSPIADMQL